MSYYEGDINHLGAPTPSQGPTSSFGENFTAALNKQYKVDSMYSIEGEMENLYNANVQRIKDLTGEDLSLPQLQGINILSAATDRKLNRSSWFSGLGNDDLVNQRLREFDQREERIKELQGMYPEIRSFDQMLDEVAKVREQTLAASDEAESTAGFTGSVGGMLGGMAGSFSFRDPLLVGSLFVGGFGSTITKRLLSEAGIAAGVEAGQQFGFVQPTQEAMGEQGTNPWTSIMLAGAGAAVLRGAFEGAAPAYRSLERRISPNAARAREFGAALDGAQMNDAMIGRMFERAPDTPSTRAARAAYDADKALRDGSPNGKSNFSAETFMADMQRTNDAYDGVRTAARVADDYTRPAFMEEVSFNRALLHSENPMIINRLDDLGARVTEADTRVQQLTESIENRTVGDAVGLVDEVSGARVKAIEEEMMRTGADTARLERELDTIIESIGPEQIAKAEKDYRIGPKRQLADARRSAKAAQRNYNVAAKEVDNALSAMKARHEAENAVKIATAIQPKLGLPQSSRVHIGDGIISPLVPQRAIEHAVATKVMAAEVPKVADAVVAAPREGGKIDIGLGTPIDEKFEVPYGVTEDGKVVIKTAKQIMDELDEDIAMVEAMRGCAI